MHRAGAASREIAAVITKRGTLAWAELSCA
jgi:hypothetical protein